MLGYIFHKEPAESNTKPQQRPYQCSVCAQTSPATTKPGVLVAHYKSHSLKDLQRVGMGMLKTLLLTASFDDWLTYVGNL